MRAAFIRFLLGPGSVLALWAPLGFARGEQETKPPQPAPQEITAGDALSWDEGDAKVTLFTGQVRVRKGEFQMSASRALVWSRGGGRGLDEIYAEGNVVLHQGAQKMRAERVYFNFGWNKAYIVDLRLQGTSESLRNQLFYVTAQEARMTAEGVLEAENLAISTCGYGVPHYHVSVDAARLVGQDARPRKGRYDIWPYVSWQIRVDEVYPELMGAPLFFIPGLVLGPWVRDFPIRSAQYGRSSRFGHFLLSEYGLKIKRQDEGGKLRIWGDVTAEADWREKRGGAYGLDLKYSWGGYTGFVDTYFLHDFGRDLDVSFDQRLEQEDPLRRAERGKAQAFHRHALGEHWRYELEAYYLSDRSLREEFFEREFKEAKDPETAAYLRWVDGSAGAYLYERHRLNDFQTQNEYLPRADFYLLHAPVAAPLLDTVYATQRFDAAHIRRRWDEDLRLESARTWRLDSITEVSNPWDLRVAQVSPFVQARLTVYEDDLEGQGEVRALWTGGARVVSQAHQTHPDFWWRDVGLRGLRHVAEVELRYANTVDANVPPSELFPFEEVDQLGEFEEVALELRQRFLTKDEQGKVFEFLQAVVSVEYYPDSDRDTTSLNPNTLEMPFHWIGLAPDESGALERRHWSNVHYEASFQPRSFLRTWAGGEYNPVARHEEVREWSAAVTPLAGLTVTGGQTFVKGVTDALSGGASWSLTPKWSVAGFVQYDIRTDEFLSQSVVVARDYHDFLLQAVVERDAGRDERRFYITVVPKFLGIVGSRMAPRRGAY